MLNPNQLATVRDWVSDKTPPTDEDLHAIFDRLGSVKAVVMTVLRKRLAAFQADPASFNADDYGQTVSANITSLERALVDLDGYSDDLSDPVGGVVKPKIEVQWLSRPGRGRR